MSKDGKFVVRLSVEERTELQPLVDVGRDAKTVRQRPRVLWKSDESGRRTKIDFAHVIRDLVDVHSPLAETIVLVMDSLSRCHLRRRRTPAERVC